jgi:uncharacterized membrane protein YcjF (UPF0283 family)
MVPTKKGMVRAVIKNKIAEFKEDAKFHQAEKWQQQGNEKSSQYQGMSAFDVLSCEYGSLVTSQRLDNAISKVGRVTKDDKVKLKELFELYVQDVLDQLEFVTRVLLSKCGIELIFFFPLCRKLVERH